MRFENKSIEGRIILRGEEVVRKIGGLTFPFPPVK